MKKLKKKEYRNRQYERNEIPQKIASNQLLPDMYEGRGEKTQN